jgi:hypothetical protein
MDTHGLVDVTFDFRSDTPDYPKNDPDVVSPTLRGYHKLLWSKPLPSGVVFELMDTTPASTFITVLSWASSGWRAMR